MAVTETADVVVIASLVDPAGLPASATTASAHGATCHAANAAVASCSSRLRDRASGSFITMDTTDRRRRG